MLADAQARPAPTHVATLRRIHLGPTLPAFLSPNVAKVLMENFGIAGIGTVQEDMQAFLA